MNNSKVVGKKIRFSYGVLVIILFATVAFLTDYILIERKIRMCDCPKCEVINKEVTNKEITNTSSETNVVEDENISFLENTELTYGCDNEINARVEDGTLIIKYSGNSSEKIIKVKEYDVRFIYVTGYMDCDNNSLFFLTKQGDLFKVPSINSLISDEYPFMMRIASNVKGINAYENEIIKLNDGQTISSFYLSAMFNDGSYNKIYWDTFYGPGIERNNIEKNW